MNYSTEVNGWYRFPGAIRITCDDDDVLANFLVRGKLGSLVTSACTSSALFWASFFSGKIGNSTIINSTEQAQHAWHNSRIYLQCVSQNSVHASQADLWLVTSYPAPSSLIRLPQNLHMQIVYFYQLCNYDLYEISESQMQKAERKGNEKRLVISAVKVWWWLQVRRALEGARAMVGSRRMLSLLHSSIIVYCVS